MKSNWSADAAIPESSASASVGGSPYSFVIVSLLVLFFVKVFGDLANALVHLCVQYVHGVHEECMCSAYSVCAYLLVVGSF